MADEKIIYDLAINGIELKANATRIQTHKRNVNSYNHVLRQGPPIGVSSGNAQFWITVELAFPNLDEINNTLRTLVACFKVSPFVQLASSYIAGAAFSDASLSGSLAGTLSNLSVYTKPNEPRSLYATLDMMIFNHAPYTNALKFKTYPYGPQLSQEYGAVADISKSNVYTGHLKTILKTVPRISDADFDTQISFDELTLVSPPVETGPESVLDADIEDIGKNLFRVNMSHANFSGAMPKMSRISSGAFGLMTRVYGGRVPISNMFLSVLDIDFYNDEGEGLLDQHRAGIAFDLAMFSGSGEEKAAKYRADKDYQRFVKVASEYDFIPDTNAPWHFSYVSMETASRNINDMIKDNNTANVEGVLSSKRYISEHADFIEAYQEFLVVQKNNGWLPTSERNTFKKKAIYTLPSSRKYNDATDAVVTSLNVAMTNSITSIPLLGHEYPTHQYLGGKHVRAIFSAEGKRGGTLDGVKFALNRAHKNGLEFHKVKNAASLTISNPVTKMLGLNAVLGDSTESSTVPGNPEMDIFVFSLTEHDPFFEENLSQEHVLATNQIKDRAFAIMRNKRYFKYSPITELHSAATSTVGLYDPKTGKFIKKDQDPSRYSQLEAKGVVADVAAAIVTGIQTLQVATDKGTYTEGYKRDYVETLPDYNAPLSVSIDKVANILNNIILDEEIDERYISEMGDLHGFADMVIPEIAKRKEKTDKDLADAKWDPELAALSGGFSTTSVQAESAVIEPIDYGKIAGIYSDLSEVFWDMLRGGVFDLKQFNVIRSDMEKVRKASLVPCYPDLNLPSIDTNPNFYYYEDMNDGKFTEDLVRDIEGYQDDILKIVHDMEVAPYTTSSTAKKELGLIPPDVSSDSPAENGEARPEEYGKVETKDDKTKYFELNQNDTKTTHNYDEASIRAVMDKHIAKVKDDTGHYSMNKAFPTYKIFFIEEDYGEEFNILPRLSFDEFFGFNAVHDIKVIRSRKVPADLCIISMSNESGKLSDTTQYNNGNLDKFYEDKNESKINTTQENPVDALLLRPGQRIQVRLGYDNNPENLDIVFNGQIVEVQPGKVVQIVCQSYATELVSQVKGLHRAESITKVKDKVTSGLINYVMQAPEIVHFGNKRKNWFISMLASYEDLEDRANSLYGPNLNPRDDNVFAPQPHTYIANMALLDPSTWNEAVDIELWNGLKSMAWGAVEWGGTAAFATANPYAVGTAAVIGAGFNADKLVKRYGNLDYKIHQTTVWDILKEMELRHPGWVASVVPYGNRMTLFFGTPDMEYWYRPDDLLDKSRVSELDKMKAAANDPGKVYTALSQSVHLPTQYSVTDIKSGVKPIFYGEEPGVLSSEFEKRKATQAHRIKPFRDHHYLSDTVNIIANNISVNADAYNAATVQYVEDVMEDADDETGRVNYDYDNYETLKADADLRDETVNLLFSQQPNCEKKHMARRYALGLLLRHMKDMYGGSITVLGNSEIKPYDTCHIFDKITDMYGPVEVEQVVHHFSQETGFITEIVPDLCVSGNQYATLPISQAMSQFFGVYDMMVFGVMLGGPGLTLSSKGYAAGKAIAELGIGETIAAAGPKLGKQVGPTIVKATSQLKSAGSKVSIDAALKVTSKAKDTVSASATKTWDALKSKKFSKGFFKLLGKGSKFIGKGGWLGIGAGILYAAGSYYVKKTQLKQPVLIHPLTLNKKPLVGGIEGFKQDDLKSSFIDAGYLFSEGVTDARKDAEEMLKNLEKQIF